MLAKWIRGPRSSFQGVGAPPGPRPPVPFGLLVHAHAPYVARCARRAGADRRDVEDVVQDVLLATHQAIGRGLDAAAPLKPWLRAVTYRNVRDRRKLAKHQRERLSPTGEVDRADRGPTPEEQMQAIDVHRLVDGVLDTLPPDLRIVLAMSDIEEMPMSEIAEVLEIPEGTGYSRLRAARRAFETAWQERRASGHAVFLPFALWDARDLIHAARPVPDLPAEVMDAVWRRLAGALGPGIAGGAAAGAAAGAAKGGAVLTATKVAVGALVAMLAGAALHAAMVSAGSTPQPSESPATASGATAATVTGATATAVTPVTPAPLASTVPITPTARAADGDASERKWLEAARDAIERGDAVKARAALARVRSPRFAEEREQLRRLVDAYEDGGAR